jgi:hypothetical protein
MALGFLMYNKDKISIKISKVLDACLWVLSLSVLIAVILLSYLFANPTVSYKTSLLSNALFMSLHRLAWSVALSYMIFACEHLKSGSIIREILSSSTWKPIGTKGLSLYITHLIFMLFMIINQHQQYDFTIWRMVRINLNFISSTFLIMIFLQLHTYSGDLLPCFIIAIVFYLAFEAPIMIIENYLFKKITNRGE